MSETAVVDAILVVLGGAIGLAFITATQLRINLANFYVASLNTGAVLRAATRLRLPHGVVLLGVCALAAVLMETEGVFRYMLVSLQMMGVALCSWVGATLFVPSRLMQPDDRPVAWKAGPMIAWLSATVAGAVISFLPGSISSFASPVSFLAAAILSLLLRRVYPAHP